MIPDLQVGRTVICTRLLEHSRWTRCKYYAETKLFFGCYPGAVLTVESVTTYPYTSGQWVKLRVPMDPPACIRLSGEEFGTYFRVL